MASSIAPSPPPGPATPSSKPGFPVLPWVLRVSTASLLRSVHLGAVETPVRYRHLPLPLPPALPDRAPSPRTAGRLLPPPPLSSLLSPPPCRLCRAVHQGTCSLCRGSGKRHARSSGTSVPSKPRISAGAINNFPHHHRGVAGRHEAGGWRGRERAEECALTPGKCRLGGTKKVYEEGIITLGHHTASLCTFLPPQGTAPLPAKRRNGCWEMKFS